MTREQALAEVAERRLLSLGLAVPTVERLDELAALAKGLLAAGSPSAALADVAARAREGEVEDRAAAYQDLFGGATELAPYEGTYEIDPFRQLRGLSDIAGFYRAFGADPHGPAAERADHAGTELEFLAFLAVRRLEAEDAGRSDEAALCAEIEETFLREHAGRWLPTFFRELEAKADEPFYTSLARLGLESVTAQLERREIEPEALPARRGRLAVEDDSFECGAGDLVGPLVPGTDPPRARRRRKRR